MALTIGQFAALFLFSCLSGAFTGLFVSMVWGVWGGLKPLTRRLNDLESDAETLQGRFSRHQKSMSGLRSVDSKKTKVPPEFAPAPFTPAPDERGIEYVG